MAKIAPNHRQALDHALAQRAERGAPAGVTPRLLAQGDGWSVEDVICTSGPRDRTFEECHSMVRIAIIAAGSFVYRAQHASHVRSELMTPGSALLGNVGECFECGHDHGSGDRCISFGYTPSYFERLAAGAGILGDARFRARRLPPLRELSPLVTQACAGLSTEPDVPWEELSTRLAGQVIQLASGASEPRSAASPSSIARVTKTVRRIECHSEAELTLQSLALEAGLTPFHFLRTFEQVTGVTPHQFVLRSRLRAAAARLASEPAKVVDIALDCGFGDVSNFNRAFRKEFGVSPRQYRRSN